MRSATVILGLGLVLGTAHAVVVPVPLLATVPSGFTDGTFASGLSSATAMELAPDGRLFVCQQGGALRVFSATGASLGTFMTLSVDPNGERGLLGITFHPNFSSNRFLYVYYTVPGSPPHNRVSRFTASASNGNVVEAGSEMQILNLENLSATNHNGGAVHFGTDGMLYVAVGDNASGSNSQSLSNRLGKILRVNPDGSIPTNPSTFPGITGSTAGVNRAIWAVGLRNPFTFAVRPGTGRIFINDVGQNTWEEINDGISGSNYGWPGTEGATTNPNYRTPLHAYGHGSSTTTGNCIAGGTFYNPSTVRFPASYVGQYFYADHTSGWIRVMNPSNNSTSLFATGVSSPVDLKTGSDGRLYYLERGRVGVIDYPPPSTPPSITSQPANRTVPVGGSATFTVSASGSTPLSYQWQRNNGAGWSNITGATSASYTFSNAQTSDNGAQFRCVVTNAVGSVTSNAATLTVTANTAPTAAITAPASGARYNAGQTINYAGTGTDAQDGTLPASAFSWTIMFHHDTHTHPFLGPINGVTSGSFAIPTAGETAANVWYRISLTVTDSGGLPHTVTRDILPNTANLTLTTTPPGLQVTLDGQPQTAPYTVQGVVGMTRTLGVVSPQSSGGTTYVFSSWSDGGNASHTISTPSTNTTYTATFGAAPATLAFQQDSGGDGIVSMEAESASGNTSQGAHDWLSDTTYPGFSGTGAQRALPDNGGLVDTNYAPNSPRLDFLVNFVATGPHYVWVLGVAPDGAADSAHVGLNGVEVATASRISGFALATSYSWGNTLMPASGGGPAVLDITATGAQIVNVWMREDGFVFDKIVLTTNSAFVPTGMGPAQSALVPPVPGGPPGGGGGGGDDDGCGFTGAESLLLVGLLALRRRRKT